MPPTSTQVTPQLPHGKAPISAVILARNEEANIGPLLDNISDLADEMIVIDMQSEDKTAEIARRYTPHVYSHPLISDFDAARNPARDRASHEWILVMDADERLPARLKSKFREVVENDLADYVVNQRRNYVLGYPLKHGDYGDNWGTRLFKNQFASPYSGTVHEPPRFHGRMLTLPDEPDLTILHDACPTIDSLVTRLQRYTPQEARALQRIGYTFSPLKLVARPVSYFIRSYLFQQGFRDGLPGLIYAVHSAYYIFLSRARVWENLKRGNPGEEPVGIDAKDD